MTLDEFRAIDSQKRAGKPKLFLLAIPDRPATVGEIELVQGILGIELPSCYTAFLKEYGGGEFGLTNVFSADADGEFYLPKRQAEASMYLPRDLLAFSDDFSGGLYVLKVFGEKALDPVFYWNQDGGLVVTAFANIFEFVARYAYEPA